MKLKDIRPSNFFRFTDVSGYLKEDTFYLLSWTEHVRLNNGDVYNFKLNKDQLERPIEILKAAFAVDKQKMDKDEECRAVVLNRFAKV